MKQLLLSVFIFISCLAKSQSADSIKAPYLQDRKLPFFKIMLTDSSFFYKDNLKKNRATIIIFFSPECEHCKKMTELLIENIKEFKRIQIVMVSPLPFDKIKEFYSALNISNYPSIKMGKDALYFFANYFQNQYLPFIASYNKKGELIKGWEGTIKIKELLESVQ